MSYRYDPIDEMGISDADIEYFNKLNPAHKATGATIWEHYIDVDGRETGTNYVIFTGDFTAYGMARDCGDHLIIARYSRFDRIDKDTLKITYDVKDM